MNAPLNTRQKLPEKPHSSHVEERHRFTPHPSPSKAPLSVPITLDGCHVADLVVRPGTDPATSERIAATLDGLNAWARLGGELAARGPHRLAIAARAARAAASGGIGVSTEEERRIGCWFTGIVDEAIHRGGLHAAGAIWSALVGDSHADPFAARSSRCPAVAEVPPPPAGFTFDPDDPGGPKPDPAEAATFLARLRSAAAGYVHTAIAGASDADIAELREIIRADDDALEDYRPWGIDLAAEASSSESLDNARSMLTCRHLSIVEACNGFADWAHGFAGIVAEHALPPVFRIGAIAWLARVVLRPNEVPMQDRSDDPPAPPLVRHIVELEAIGWHVVALRPSTTGDEPPLWRVTIERYDESASMTLTEADPDIALAELVRYAQADAT